MVRKRILGKGTTCLLLAGWTAKLCILFPLAFAGLSMGNAARGVVAGLLLWCLVLAAIQKWVRPGQDFFQMLETRAGRKPAVIVCAASLWYFLAHTAVFARLWAELLRAYLTPVVPAAVLCVLPLAAGLVVSGKSLDLQACSGRTVWIVLFGLFALLAALAVNEVPAGAYRIGEPLLAGSAAERMAGSGVYGSWVAALGARTGIDRALRFADGFLPSAFELFACMGGMFLPLLAGYPVSGQPGETPGFAPESTEYGVHSAKKRGWNSVSGRGEDSQQSRHVVRAFRLAGCVCAALAGAFCLASDVLLSAQERQAADFPVVEAMRWLSPLGINMGRLENVLVLLLLAGLAMTVVCGAWCVRRSFAYLYAAGAEFCRGRTMREIRAWLSGERAGASGKIGTTENADLRTADAAMIAGKSGSFWKPFGRNDEKATNADGGLAVGKTGSFWRLFRRNDEKATNAGGGLVVGKTGSFWKPSRGNDVKTTNADGGLAAENGRPESSRNVSAQNFAARQGLFRTEFADELSKLPGRHGAKYYGIKMTKKLPGALHGESIRAYGGKISDSLTAKRLWWWFTVLLLYVLVLGFADAFSALAFYRAYNMQILVPVMLVLYAAAAGLAREREYARDTADGCLISEEPDGERHG